jgi:Leucine Rich repeat
MRLLSETQNVLPRLNTERIKGMRSFLCFLTVLALSFSFAASVQTPKGQERAIDTIKRLGGTFEVDKDSPGDPIVKVDLHGTSVSDDDLEALESLKSLRHLDLRLTKVGDKGVSHLKRLTSLRFLNLFRTQTGDAGLKQLKSMSELETLLIGGTKVSDAGLAYLKSHPKLKKLSLFDTQVGDAGLAHLRSLGKLEVLLIGKSKITEEAAKALQKDLPKVRFSENM